MIYMTMTDGAACIIVEPANLQKLKDGKPMTTPDEKILVCYTPDMPYTAERILAIQVEGKLTPEQIAMVLRESANRAEVIR